MDNSRNALKERVLYQDDRHTCLAALLSVTTDPAMPPNLGMHHPPKGRLIRTVWLIPMAAVSYGTKMHPRTTRTRMSRELKKPFSLSRVPRVAEVFILRLSMTAVPLQASSLTSRSCRPWAGDRHHRSLKSSAVCVTLEYERSRSSTGSWSKDMREETSHYESNWPYRYSG